MSDKHSKSDLASGELAHLSAKLDQLIAVVERAVPPRLQIPNIDSANAFVWNASQLALQPVLNVNRVDLALLRGINQSRDLLAENTRRFANGLPANNVLLWGARGMGKSSLVKAAHHAIAASTGNALKLVEIHREDITTLPTLLG
ncbi:MAG: DUF815 domain-containing protein, partial [Pseudomonadota bacterium]